MSLMEHLQELRTRLWKATIAVSVLGAVSLIYARELFEILMRPVLAALPEGHQALIYTSGIEEINVLLKVGMYAGVFLAAPILLYQIWGFIAPGLYPNERRYVTPFVSLGTVFFVGGALFCYFAVLPTMFKFLLQEGDERDVRHRAFPARAAEVDAARLLRLGNPKAALALLDAAHVSLSAKGDGQVEESSKTPTLGEVKVLDVFAQARLDEAVALAGPSEAARALVAKAAQRHAEAAQSLADERAVEAARALDEVVALTAQADEAAVAGAGATATALWRLDKHLAAADRRVADLEWTRPMLSMREQLSLVLLLEVAFGIIFELPLIMSLLAWLGVVTPAFLAKYQRHAILLCVVAAAIITPSGDAVNLALMAVPMIVCYELGVLGAFIVGRRKKTALAVVDVPPS
jgi:sec-independent protein translocase protein TatC